MNNTKIIHSVVYGICCLFFLIILNSCPNDSIDQDYGTVPGIALGFDDGVNSTWEQHLDLFDQYEAKVTFFVTAGSVSNFMFNAQSRGHEIGYHTVSHPHLPEVSIEKFFEETISRINVFRDAGIELTTFAYPHGDYQPWMNDELLKYYKVVRGFHRSRTTIASERMKQGFVYSMSIDNINYRSEPGFKMMIDNVLSTAKRTKTIAVLTSHRIDSGDWGITPERLEYVLKKGQEMDLRFYTYKDLQNW